MAAGVCNQDINLKSKFSHIIVILFIVSCGQSSTDNVKLTETSNARIHEVLKSFTSGKIIFQKHCSYCHAPPDEFAWDAYTFDHLFERLPKPPEDYFMRYIQDSKKLKMAGDSYANKLDTTYNSDYEHNFKDTLSEQDMEDLIVFIKVGVELKNQ